MFIVDFAIKNLWIWMIFGSIYLAFLIRFSSKKYIEKEPELKEGYKQLIKGILMYFNIPWVVAGIAIVFGKVPDFFSLSDLASRNPFAFSYWTSIFILWLLGVWWIYFKGGAEFLAKHPSTLSGRIRSPMLVKVLVGVGMIIIAASLFRGHE